jgi:predicted transposase YbfD/YdcC
MGLQISKRQVVRLMSAGLEALVAEDRAVLRTGLETARWISVDDTSARHAGKDGFVTQMGDKRFTVFRSAMSKSRRTFLSLLQAGRTDYVVNAAALAKMRELAMAAPVLALLARHPAKRFSDEAAWHAHLKGLGFDALGVTPDPVNIATEGALWGAVCEQGLLDGTVIVSDGAGQFNVGEHALCWIHAERLVYKLQPSGDAQRRALNLKRSLIWWFYADLKAYQREPGAKRARALRVRFDRIFTTKTGYVMLDRQLARLHRHKADLLRVLDRPEIPLHTNGSENDIRSIVTKRKISGGTQKDIAARIVAKKADYVLALKGNQGTLQEDAALFFADPVLTADCPCHEEKDGDHGRIEQRMIRAANATWLAERHPEWKGLASIVCVTVRRTIKKTGATSTETRLFISSLPPDPLRLATAVRAHWSVENNLHWVLDVTFREDACRTRKDHSARNLATIRRAVLNILRRDSSKGSLKRKRLKAALNPAFRAEILSR